MTALQDGRLLIAGGSQRLDSYGQRELFAEKTTHESAAADLASIFEAAKGQQNFAPARQDGFAREHFAEYHAIAVEQHLAGGFERGGAVVGFDWIEKRPAAGAVARPRSTSAALTRTALGIDKRAKIVEAVGSKKAGSDQLP